MVTPWIKSPSATKVGVGGGGVIVGAGVSVGRAVFDGLGGNVAGMVLSVGEHAFTKRTTTRNARQSFELDLFILWLQSLNK